MERDWLANMSKSNVLILMNNDAARMVKKLYNTTNDHVSVVILFHKFFMFDKHHARIML